MPSLQKKISNRKRKTDTHETEGAVIVVEDDPEETLIEEDQEDPNFVWIPDYETINFDAGVPMLLDAPTIFQPEDMSRYRVYSNIKMLASFISRARVTGDSIQSIARKLLLKLRGQIASTHKTLQALGGEIGSSSSGIDPGLYECLHQYLRILIHDLHKGNPRHKCTRTECQVYCILPMYARRCLSDTDVHMLFQNLQNILTENDSLLISTGRTPESKSALNILRYLVTLDSPSLYGLYDVLLAMSGHHKTIVSTRAKVDSKLYGLIFDLIRYNDYERYEGRHETRVIEAMKQTASLPWLNLVEYPTFEEEFRNVIQPTIARNIEVSNIHVPSLPSATDTRVPPAVTDSRASRVPPSITGSRVLRIPSSETDPRTSIRQTAMTSPSTSREPTVTDASAPPPSYESVIVIPPSASIDTDDGLPTYEHFLVDIVEGSEN